VFPDFFSSINLPKYKLVKRAFYIWDGFKVKSVYIFFPTHESQTSFEMANLLKEQVKAVIAG
jgi:hypothetical protein